MYMYKYGCATRERRETRPSLDEANYVARLGQPAPWNPLVSEKHRGGGGGGGGVQLLPILFFFIYILINIKN